MDELESTNPGSQKALLRSDTGDYANDGPRQLSLSGIEMTEDSPIFRPIHYIGSKLRIVEPIRSVVDELDPTRGPVCDLFSGSGTVSAALSRDRTVVSVDIQEYSRVICNALLRPVRPAADSLEDFIAGLNAGEGDTIRSIAKPLIEHEFHSIKRALDGDPEPLCDLLEHGSIVAYDLKMSEAYDPNLLRALKVVSRDLTKLRDVRTATALRYFGGVYFSYEQAAELDRVLRLIDRFSTEASRDTFLAALLSTASDVVNTVGKQFAQPIRPRDSDGNPKRHLIGQIERDRSVNVANKYLYWFGRYRDLPATYRPHSVIRGDYSEVLKNLPRHLGIVYADPPYTRDHYSRFYHVLETLCRRDEPQVSRLRLNGKEQLSRGIYREIRHQSPFCIRSQAPHAFEKLFSAVARRKMPLVLSYSPDTKYEGSRPRVVSVDVLQALAEKSFRKVDRVSAGAISHSRLNSTERTLGRSDEAELLFLCRH